LHQAIRKLFKGRLDTETDTTEVDTDDGQKIVVKWGRGGRGARGGGRGGDIPAHLHYKVAEISTGGAGDRPSRGNYPPYIHFTMQKTNRDTQDALSHLSRILHVNGKELSVAGTKDKRGVTVQRVSLRRGNKAVEDIWRLANGQGKKAYDQATKQRAERGVRIADFNYRKASLELGMLKGNAFVITLRFVLL
jgi:tRNA pseudouridine13 synthase